MNRTFPETSVVADRPAIAGKSRFEDIDRVKAVAILLVVAGHVWDPLAPAWALTLHFDIYNFHMPLFMYLSGYVYYRALRNPKNADFRMFCAERARRLLVPYFVFSAFFINLRYFGRMFVDIRRSDFTYWDGYKYMFVETDKNPAFDMWYLFVLFVFSIASFHLMRKGTGWLYALLVLSLGAYGVFAYYEPRGGMTDAFSFGHMCWFYVFFVTGAVSCAFRDSVNRVLSLVWPLAAVLFLIAEAVLNNISALVTSPDVYAILSGWRFLVLGLLSAAFLQGALLRPLPRLQPLLRLLSEHTLIIYLFNSTVIGAMQQVIAKVHWARSLPYSIQFLLLTIAGTAVPMMLRFAIFKVERLRPIRPYLA